MVKTYNIALIIALKLEARDIEYSNIHISGVGKVNATIATMKAIQDGADEIINFGTAGSNNNLISGLVEVTGYVDRDMNATVNGFKLGQTPYEKNVLVGTQGIVCGTGDTFATTKPLIDCDIVDMESYAIAKTCMLHNIPFKSYKYISDNTNEKSPTAWLENVSKGNKLFQKELNKIVR